MHKKSGAERLREACRRNTYHRLLESYVESCRPLSETEDPNDRHSSKNAKKSEGRFPNLAGFCRFLKMGTDDLSEIAKEFPDAVAYLSAVFEDEALNASISPTLLTAYLKRRLGYDRDSERKENASSDGIPMICFEHDIFRDGG